MITDTIISIGNYVLTFIIGLLPMSSGLPDAVHTASNFFGNYVGMLNPLVPIETLRTVLGLLIAVELIIFSFKTAKWLVSHLPFIGGRG